MNARIDGTNEALGSTNARIDRTNEALGSTNARIDGTNERLEAMRADLATEIESLRKRSVESEIRLATATTQLSGDVLELTALIRDWRLEHRADRASIAARVARLEDHVGLDRR